MPLNKEEIKGLGIIGNPREKGFGTANYDLHAKWVIKTPENSVEDWKRFPCLSG